MDTPCYSICICNHSFRYHNFKDICNLLQIHKGNYYLVFSLLEYWGMDQDIIVHNGGCHCGKVRWQVQAPNSVVAWKWNCSDCSMRGNVHFSVPSERFELLGDSKEFLTTYTFGTHTAKHTFCKVFGITSFYIPDQIRIELQLHSGAWIRELSHVEIKHYDGRNWESSYVQTGIAVCSMTEEPK